MVWALFLMVSGLLPPSGFWIFVVMSALMGVVVPFFGSLVMALLQEKVEAEYLGRVMGLSHSVMGLASPLGLLPAAILVITQAHPSGSCWRGF